MVAVEARERIAMASGVRDIEVSSGEFVGGASCGRRGCSGGSRCLNTTRGRHRSIHLIARVRINLLKSQAYLHTAEFHCDPKRAMAGYPHDEFEAMAAIPSPPRILPSGDAAITVEFSRTIDAQANARVLALDRILAREAVAGITETVPTYRSLLVH